MILFSSLYYDLFSKRYTMSISIHSFTEWVCIGHVVYARLCLQTGDPVVSNTAKSPALVELTVYCGKSQ